LDLSPFSLLQRTADRIVDRPPDQLAHRIVDILDDFLDDRRGRIVGLGDFHQPPAMVPLVLGQIVFRIVAGNPRPRDPIALGVVVIMIILAWHKWCCVPGIPVNLLHHCNFYMLEMSGDFVKYITVRLEKVECAVADAKFYLPNHRLYPDIGKVLLAGQEHRKELRRVNYDGVPCISEIWNATHLFPVSIGSTKHTPLAAKLVSQRVLYCLHEHAKRN